MIDTLIIKLALLTFIIGIVSAHGRMSWPIGRSIGRHIVWPSLKLTMKWILLTKNKIKQSNFFVGTRRRVAEVRRAEAIGGRAESFISTRQERRNIWRRGRAGIICDVWLTWTITRRVQLLLQLTWTIDGAAMLCAWSGAYHSRTDKKKKKRKSLFNVLCRIPSCWDDGMCFCWVSD